MSERFTRRALLKRGAALAAAGPFARGPLILTNGWPSEKLGVAVIGSQNMGGYSLDCSLRERCVAIVDVDDKLMGKAMKIATDRAKGARPPKSYYDYRKMLDECAKDIDVVLVATPDHNHAPAAIRAIKMGKHAFCQKPLAHNLYVCYALAKAAREKKVLTQMGNQGYCGEEIRRVAEYIQSGIIGDVTESHTILGRNFGGSGGRPPSKPAPAHLHWDEWIGPAPYRDYHDGLHPFSWRDWRDFGTGTIGDMACHHVAYPFMALKLAEVKKFTVECINTRGGSQEKYPQDNVVCYHVPARTGQPPCKVFVYDHHGLMPEIMKETGQKYGIKWGEDTLFVGTKGMITNKGKLLPPEQFEKAPQPPRIFPRAHGGPIEDLFWCIKNNGTPPSNFPDAAGPLTSIALTGHLAQFAGKGSRIEWDVEKMRCTNNAEANRYVKRDYRKGWEV